MKKGRPTTFLSLGFTALFPLCALAAHLLKPELSFIADPLSRYALGKHGSVMVIGLLSIGLGEICLSISLMKRTGTAGPLLLRIAAAGAVMAGLFPLDTDGAATLAGRLHSAGAALQFLFFPLSLIPIRKAFTGNLMRGYTVATAAVTLFFFILGAAMLASGTARESGTWGLFQKSSAALITAWLITASSVMGGGRKG